MNKLRSFSKTTKAVKRCYSCDRCRRYTKDKGGVTYRHKLDADRTRFFDVRLSCNTNEQFLHLDSYSHCRIQKGGSTDEYVATVNPNADIVFPIW